MTPKILEIIELPPVDISELVSPDATVVTRICVIMREIKPALRSAISILSFRPAAMIADLFGTEAMVVADELEIPKYVYVPSNAWFLALQIYTPQLDKIVEGEYVDQKEPLKIPGCRPIRPEDLVDPMLDRTNQQYFENLRIGVQMPMCNGILLNTWQDLQPSALEALRDEELLGRIVKVPVYPIGPLIRQTKPLGTNSELFIWLDKQPRESVIYVSFGSGGTLSLEQMAELAFGLELSQQNFIWVVRPPTLKTGDGSFFNAGTGEDNGTLRYLPEEQRMNATMLTEELGVAVRSKTLPSKGVVAREEIEMLIRRIMVDKEGTEIRTRAKELKYGAENALVQGGSSMNALSTVAKECEISSKRQKMTAW
ncbi:unnamed protein product [Dovyalis caffra]|uniref:Uncharacterized protein n=1 Tax=Dovyalis caffra TaxID=77055 RepID=A0AAV1RS53_9ROSI|nr:unnamed protein product [Dovyalis caffra]